LQATTRLQCQTILFGGKGVVSVISNYAPKIFSQMVNLALDGDYESAMNIHYDLLDLFALNFIETNPIPVKAALVLMGMIEENYRLPLIRMRPENKKLLQKALKKHKLVSKDTLVNIFKQKTVSIFQRFEPSEGF
jgi:4-hydroxy-tetrahydrodipicolinate synthase